MLDPTAQETAEADAAPCPRCSHPHRHTCQQASPLETPDLMVSPAAAGTPPDLPKWPVPLVSLLETPPLLQLPGHVTCSLACLAGSSLVITNRFPQQQSLQVLHHGHVGPWGLPPGMELVSGLSSPGADTQAHVSHTLGSHPTLSKRCSSIDPLWWVSHLDAGSEGFLDQPWQGPRQRILSSEPVICVTACLWVLCSSGIVEMGSWWGDGSWNRPWSSWSRVWFGLPHLPLCLCSA